MCDYILGGAAAAAGRDAFLARFDANAMSPGFDPDADLQRIGMANQTTMLKVGVRVWVRGGVVGGGGVEWEGGQRACVCIVCG